MINHIRMSDNVCEWGDGRQCPNLSLEDGSIFAQLCTDHARQEAYACRQEFGDVCLWCAHSLPDPDECEFGEHDVIPDAYPDVMPSDAYLIDNEGKQACDSRGAHDPGAEHTYEACPMAGLPVRS